MPTGYTAPITEKEGYTFQQFAMSCARAFGACIEMRDDPMDAPIPEAFVPSSYHIEAITKAKAELTRLECMTGAERLVFGESKKAEWLKQYDDWLKRETNENSKYAAMLSEVEKWNPPTPDHAEFKNFMRQQIETSVSDTGYIQQHIQEVRKREPLTLWRESLGSAKRDVNYHGEEHRKEIDRAKSRTDWVKALRTSLTPSH